jgi:hypothetical protein
MMLAKLSLIAACLAPALLIQPALADDGLIAPASLKASQARAAVSQLIAISAPVRAAPWPAGFEVVINYAPPLASQARIWIADARGKMIRVLPRAAGSSAVWDGRNDQGDLVAQGRYVIAIQILGEHGGRSLQTIPLDITRTPALAQAPAQGEAGPAQARLKRQAA